MVDQSGIHLNQVGTLRNSSLCISAAAYAAYCYQCSFAANPLRDGAQALSGEVF